MHGEDGLAAAKDVNKSVIVQRRVEPLNAQKGQKLNAEASPPQKKEPLRGKEKNLFLRLRREEGKHERNDSHSASPVGGSVPANPMAVQEENLSTSEPSSSQSNPRPVLGKPKRVLKIKNIKGNGANVAAAGMKGLSKSRIDAGANDSSMIINPLDYSTISTAAGVAAGQAAAAALAAGAVQKTGGKKIVLKKKGRENGPVAQSINVTNVNISQVNISTILPNRSVVEETNFGRQFLRKK